MVFDFVVFPTLTTPRLLLREMVPQDAQGIFAIRGDYDVTKYNIGPAYTTITQAQNLISAMADAYAEKDQLRWGITLPPAQTVIGMVGFNYWDRTDHRASVGFDLAQAYWRQGIMREALNAIITFGFEEMQLNRIEADCSLYNTASAKLLLSIGFVQEGHQREQYYEDEAYHDLLLFSLLRREWQNSE